MSTDPTTEVRRTVEAVWRIESARIVAVVARVVRDVGLAEDLAQDAVAAALETWPRTGVPDNPAAWLTVTARRRAIDLVRREQNLATKQEELAREEEYRSVVELDPADALLDEDEIEDDLLRLVFIACHPVLSTQSRVALTLRLLGGLTTDEIARAYLVSEPTVAQRIVRAKRTLADADVPFELPSVDERAERLASVLEVVYLIFNEGYAATSGDEWMRPELCEEAMRLGRVLAELVPDDPEVHGLVALMEIQASRLRARRGSDGEPVLLLDQQRSLWDRVLINHGLAALDRANSLDVPVGPYMLQAELAACHARAATAEATDWERIAALYAVLGAVAPSPVVELNRAVALGMAQGPEAGLEHLETIAGHPLLAGYHLVPSVRGDLLLRLGRVEEGREQLRLAASMTRNERERAALLAKAAEPA